MHLLSGHLPALISLVLPILGAPTVTPRPASGLHGISPSIVGRRSPNVPSPHVISLSRTPITSPNSRHGKSLQEVDHGNGTIGIVALTNYADILYYADITVGTETFKVVVDTGSADTWLIEEGFTCVDVYDGLVYPEAKCAFGPPYKPSTTFTEVPGENFNISYLDGEALTGTLGRDVVTLGGVTVKDQTFGVVNYAAWNGDNSTSGLLGLAFPNITSAYSGTDPKLDSEANAVPYNPLFTNMYTQGLVAPLFSLAISRNSTDGGLLALGGLPPVKHDPYFACTPFQIRTRVGQVNSTPPVYQYYYINVDGLEHGNITDKVSTLASVDSGTSLIFLPSPLAYAVNQQFEPPAFFDRFRGEYVVDCEAKAPRFGVNIANHTFYVNPKDLIIQTQDGACITGITGAAFGHSSVLGDVFMRNVLAVFDVGASEMRFAARENY
ncbi:MAG: hypothetical protein LQ344_006558 [Seirophora lacunosa]|nr:MAG: hypothetical protein LQ344_006558 [Seirophora lacunosa]